jgi:hypothetical protein
MVMRRGVLVFLVATILAVACAIACGQSAVGVDACTSIEHARCQWIVQCFADAANYGLPTRRSDSDGASPVDDCYRYYDDACLHGLVTSVSPVSSAVSACVTAINNATDCKIIYNPETADACAFLYPSDAGSDADAH